MKFHEKLRRRVAELGLNKSKAARAVGLHESVISNYLFREDSLPRVDIALKIARACKVPLEWLADDNMDWPPPAENAPALYKIGDRDLVFELAARWRRKQDELLLLLDQAEKMDWGKFAASLRSYYEKKGVGQDEIIDGRTIVFKLITARADGGEGYDISRFSDRHHDAMPGSERDRSEFDAAKINDRISKILANKSFAEAVHIENARVGYVEGADELIELINRKNEESGM